ncbi:hypothetical protein, partial [Gemmiger formicilis]|uniref:hypothetical protein n=1 Tax=Gemmiger formicilis TaxID=745368 RepID=UPI001956F958
MDFSFQYILFFGVAQARLRPVSALFWARGAGFCLVLGFRCPAAKSAGGSGYTSVTTAYEGGNHTMPIFTKDKTRIP